MKAEELKGYDSAKKLKILVNHPLKKYTTFQIGGPADFFAEPKNIGELQELIKICRFNHLSHYILGHGSNILFTDKGFRGMIIYLGEHFNYIIREGNDLRVGAGTLLKDVSEFALKEGLEGVVFACGIPGSMGGAVYMNAGAYGGEMKQIVRQVKVLDAQGQIKYYTGEEMNFGYRNSRIQSGDEIIIEALLHLRCGNQEEMRAETLDLTQRREEKQPLEMPSAGSTFKRPEGYFAGKLIMDAGLAGFQYGGAAVSSKHCGFIINKNNATFADVIGLIDHIRKTVKDKFGVEMHPEVRIVGER